MSYYRQGPSRPGGGIQIGLPGVTPMVKAIIVTTVAMYVVDFLFKQFGVYLALNFGIVPYKFVHGFVWQPLTYMLLHGGFTHILFNMLMLWMFGGDLERRWGGPAFLRFYIVSGLGGAFFIVVLAYLIPASSVMIPTIGASGAIFGVMTAYGVIFGERTVLMMMLFPVKARTMVLIMFVITLMSTISQPGDRVSHAAHLGGAIVGFAYLKRIWRVGEFYRELRWKYQRRRFKVMDKQDTDRWTH
ncbi:MAG: rhomboid family intramembrane serine protease [Acidobacteriota bacterium]|nr:rhomboid family intramembrane serine protease [Acidobacteriota bacterium]MDH3784473.1 rhomboid family intramembrane serine protease [Acidobacteriota bacterium]